MDSTNTTTTTTKRDNFLPFPKNAIPGSYFSWACLTFLNRNCKYNYNRMHWPKIWTSDIVVIT